MAANQFCIMFIKNIQLHANTVPDLTCSAVVCWLCIFWLQSFSKCGIVFRICILNIAYIVIHGYLKGANYFFFLFQRYRYVEAHQVDRKLHSLEQNFISDNSVSEEDLSKITLTSQWRAGLVVSIPYYMHKQICFVTKKEIKNLEIYK